MNLLGPMWSRLCLVGCHYLQ